MTELMNIFGDDASPDYYVGQVVDLWRKSRGIQQRELALKAGIKQGSLSRKINGVQAWSLTDLVRIAAALEIEVSTLVDGIEHLLPNLDSNQEPAGYLFDQVSAWHPSMGAADVVSLSDYRAERAS